MDERLEMLAKKHLSSCKEELIKENIKFDEVFFEDELFILKHHDNTDNTDNTTTSWCYGYYGIEGNDFVKRCDDEIIDATNYTDEDLTIRRILQWHFEEFWHDPAGDYEEVTN